MFRTVLDKMFWWFLGIFAIPSTLILVSWNAVPGGFAYGIKIGLEQVALGVMVSPNLKSALQIKYTQRRFDEVQKVLPTDQAGESLNNLNHQIIAAKDTIGEIKSPQEKDIQTQSLINTLESVSQKIDQEKAATQPPQASPTTVINKQNNNRNINISNVVVQISPINTPTAIPTTSNPTPIIIAAKQAQLLPISTIPPINTPTLVPTSTTVPTKIPPTSIPTQKPASDSVVPQKSSLDISVQLEETQNNIKDVIKELKKSQDENAKPDSNSNSENHENKKDSPQSGQEPKQKRP